MKPIALKCVLALMGFTLASLRLDAQIPTIISPENSIQSEIINYDFNEAEWYYLAYTKPANGPGEFFVNGESIATLEWETGIYDHSTLNLGASLMMIYSDYFMGSLDEIRVSTKVRTPAELKSHFDSGNTFEQDTWTAYIWKLDAGAGDEFYDIDNILFGTLFGDPEWVDGKFGRALQFDGIDDRGTVDVNLPENDVTYEFWVRFDQGSKAGTQAILQPYGDLSTAFLIEQNAETPPEPREDVVFSFQDMQAPEGATILFPISVEKFTDILTFQHTIEWDPDILSFVSVQDFEVHDLNPGSFFNPEPGKLTVSWNPTDLQAESLSDGSEVYVIEFELTGPAGESTSVEFVDNPTPREISDNNGNIIDGQYLEGSIAIQSDVTIGGYIRTQTGDALPNVEVILTGSTELKTKTGTDGSFSFTVPPGSDYRILPSLDLKADESVTTLDLVFMHWHILGKPSNLSHFDLLACDVNGSNSLTTLDIAETRGVILHKTDAFGTRTAVDFVSYNYSGFPDIFDYQNYIDVSPDEDVVGLDFTSIKLGDANQSWNISGSNNREVLPEPLKILIEPGQTTGNKTIFNLSSTDFDDMLGIQFTLEWDPEAIQFSRLINQRLTFISNEASIEKGQLTALWASNDVEGLSTNPDEILAGIEFTLLDRAKDPQLSITSGITPALAFNQQLSSTTVISEIIEMEDLLGPKLNIYPNPTTDILSIEGISRDMADYSILSMSGKVIKVGDLKANSNIKVSELSNGVYFLKISDQENQVSVKKFIKK